MQSCSGVGEDVKGCGDGKGCRKTETEEARDSPALQPAASHPLHPSRQSITVRCAWGNKHTASQWPRYALRRVALCCAALRVWAPAVLFAGRQAGRQASEVVH